MVQAGEELGGGGVVGAAVDAVAGLDDGGEVGSEVQCVARPFVVAGAGDQGRGGGRESDACVGGVVAETDDGLLAAVAAAGHCPGDGHVPMIAARAVAGGAALPVVDKCGPCGSPGRAVAGVGGVEAVLVSVEADGGGCFVGELEDFDSAAVGGEVDDLECHGPHVDLDPADGASLVGVRGFAAGDGVGRASGPVDADGGPVVGLLVARGEVVGEPGQRLAGGSEGFQHALGCRVLKKVNRMRPQVRVTRAVSVWA